MRSFREESGNAGISGREMPSVEVLASMQHVEDRARALRDAGVPGTWEELKVRATLDLLQERDSRPAPGEPSAGGGSAGADGPGPDASGPHDPGPGAPGPGPGGHGPGGPGLGGPGSGSASRLSSEGPSVGAMVTITVPHTALDGDTGPAGEVAGFGILDHADTRGLLAAAARNPATRWCVTTLNPDGTAAAHGCAAGPRPWPPGQAPPGQGAPGLSVAGPASATWPHSVSDNHTAGFEIALLAWQHLDAAPNIEASAAVMRGDIDVAPMRKMLDTP